MVSFGGLARLLFGSANTRRVRRFDPTVRAINALEPELEALSDEELVARTQRFREEIAGGKTIDDLLVPAFATVREAARRALGMRHFDVQMIGATTEAIDKAEDRQKFRDAMDKLGLESPKSRAVNLLEDGMEALDFVGLPAIIRPSFTLAGTGGGIAYNLEEAREIIERGLDLSPTTEVLIEESVLGWKEFEMEVVRDRADNCIIICSIENLDPMGIHTGDSITIAPALTLTDKEYQMMRDASIAVLREIGVETGGSNVQFAVNPADGRLIVIEMNPRVSRSSALASKATGFPIAKVAAKLAVGYTLDEIANDITGGATPASFEPTIDYVVTKIPRFAFEKFPGADTVLNGITGSIGLRPTLAALHAGHRLALANKESLIVGGALVKAAAAPGQLVPVDSEHSALAQALRGGTADEVRRLVLTASGGPFRGLDRAALHAVTPAQALAHPTWDMGRVVTTNSASLVNKALEVIEAHLLFDVPLDRIDVVVHPQSVVHSMVEFVDGSTLAQASPPDMRLPIALGLCWPRRLPGAAPACDWTRAATWTFEPLDEEAFPAVRAAKEAAAASPTHMAVFNAANEEAVDAFHAGALPFDGIVDTVRAVVADYAPEHVLAAAGHDPAPTGLTVDAVLAAEAWARRAARARW